MPKWGACWGLAGMGALLLERESSAKLPKRHIDNVYCKIDHVGVSESEDADLMLCVVQEVLLFFLTQREAVLNTLGERASVHSTQEVYQGLVNTAFEMRRLILEQKRAFWTSGYEIDQQRLIKRMNAAALPVDDPEFQLPPHLQSRASTLAFWNKQQRADLHRLAQSSAFNKELRTKLHQI